MTTLLYLANARIPTEKAHGLQIMQNCEALADAGASVTLWAARRVNTPDLRQVDDPWRYYGVARNFTLWRVPCLDLQAWADQGSALQRKGSFFLQYATYLLALAIALLFRRADLYYSRDLPTVLLLGLLKPTSSASATNRTGCLASGSDAACKPAPSARRGRFSPSRSRWPRRSSGAVRTRPVSDRRP